MSDKDIISTSLGLDPIPVTKGEIVEVKPAPDNQEEDYKYARDNF